MERYISNTERKQLPISITIFNKVALQNQRRNKNLLIYKHKLKEFMTINLTLQNILKGILHTEKEDKYNHGNTRRKNFH
jgi:hypothetical protein